MKKTFYFLMALLTLTFSLGGSASAQTMPQVSDGTNTYWYYMKSQGDNLAGASDRRAKVLSKNGAGYYSGIEPWNNQSTWAKFKVVAGTIAGKYDILTEDGLFLNKGLNGDLTAINVFKSTDNTDWTFTATSNSLGVAAFRLINNDNQFLQLKTPFSLRTEYATVEDNNTWSFIPVADQGFQVSAGATEYWYTIRSLETSSPRLKSCLQINSGDFRLLTSQSAIEVWKFVAAPTLGKYYIVHKSGRYITRTLAGTNYSTVVTPDETCEFQIYPTFGVNSNKRDFIFANNFETGDPVSVIYNDPTNFPTNLSTQNQASKWMVTSLSDELANTIAAAISLKASTTEGTAALQYTADSRSALQIAIDAAQGAAGDVNTMSAAIATLGSAVLAYKASMIMPFKVSNGSTNVWYQIHDKRSPFVYWNVATVGTTPNALNRTTTADATANTQLFKFVKAPAPSMGYYIYSLTDQTNPLVAPATGDGSIIRIEAAQPAAAWIVDVATTDYYLIKKESDLRQLNSYNDKISFYQGGSADAGNNWMFVETLPTRTVTLTSNNDLYGSAVITGTATTTSTGTAPVSVTATAASSYSFVNWTNAVGGAEVSKANPYTYNGEYSIGLVANFSFYSGLASGATALNATVSANGNKQIVVCLNTQMNATAIVYNSVGQKLIEKSINAATKEISGALKPGVYMVSIQANGNKMTQKVVIK